ncbi:aspartate carbamoyltransferase catalytic subunit [Streptomyces sp. XD-27]|uniref:aspartate carbamoyltransferase catalytic subunit n=1 Tax=Streptomyces sp. XD-27 TaxID=3062779 RepID=UPI0026F41A1F|nr:aspartate carbamoyltransferase catalytic subunit [Streptomyces sp. XD-27]WKX73456.1 aspartate carbamoyltransferase catalytic subunit [Streptomyces sp. XD-27]
MKRHLISAADLTRDDAVLILDTAEELARLADRPIKKLPTLRGRTVVNLFFEDSTRTRISFEAAAKRLSADVINFSAKGSSVSKGESLKDTALTLEAMGADAVVIRHHDSGAPHRLATSGWIGGSVVNAGDGTHEHPTQALLDAFTMRRRLVGIEAGAGHDLSGRRITIVGDVLHSRVARSNVLLLNTLGAEVTLVAPPTLVPVGVENWPCEVSYDLDAVLAKSDAVMMLRVQRERMNAAFFPTEREYARRYGLDGDRMARMPEHAIVMHPGPMNRGMEITAEVADSPRCTAVEQVANGVSIRMAVLYLLLSGAELPAHPSPATTLSGGAARPAADSATTA